MILRKKVLVVEDNELNRALLSEILSSEYQVLEAENGQVALDILKQHKDSIALILLDVRMPVMDGYTFLDKVKADDELALIPVIVMTQGDSEEDEVAALSHGATDFVPKPYRPRVILHRMANLIKLRETAALDSLRKEDLPLAICLFDLDDFKIVNDTCGHDAGDRLIQSFADLLRRKTRAKDILCRYGGDEFLVLLKHMNDESAAIKKGEAICQAFHSSCSVGIAMCSSEEKNVSRLIQCADQALYRVKRENKGGCCLWNEAEGFRLAGNVTLKK